MSYNKQLEDQIDHHFIKNEELEKNKQMGGVGWLINGNMCFGIFEDLLVARAGKSLALALAEKQGIELFEQSDELQEDFISIEPVIYRNAKVLQKFLSHSFELTSGLPAKIHEEPDSNSF